MSSRTKIISTSLILLLLAPLASADLSERDRIRHFLSRTTFGVTPSLIDEVRETGIDSYLTRQLNYQPSNDAKLNKKLEPLDALNLDSKTLVKAYYDRVKQFLTDQQTTSNMPDEARLRYGIDRLVGDRQPSVKPRTQAQQIEVLLGRVDYRAIGELQNARIIRAVHSDQQLYEVMVEFWTNHFNIDIKKGASGPLKVIDDSEVIRVHALGNFRDLLFASAHSPAMLFYLDNNNNSVRRKLGWFEKRARGMAIQYLVGVDADSVDANGDASGMIGGLNENYGRELLELHTLGVDGGYTQADVIGVSRAFTGWGYNPFNGSFAFNKANHDRGPKILKGKSIARGGMKDAETALDMLASDPATAHHIAFKLCQRFVSDDPSDMLVDEVAGVFLQAKGDIPITLKAIFSHQVFYQEENIGSKLKSPLEYAVSSLRLLDADVFVEEPTRYRKLRMTLEGLGSTGYAGEVLSKARQKSVNWRLVEMGQPLFAYSAPTGYPEDASYWRVPGLAMQRMNFALALINGEITGVDIGEQNADALLRFVQADLGLLRDEIDNELVVAAVIASPEFQYR